MDLKYMMKMIAGGALLFGAGALTTAIAIGQLPLGTAADKGKIETIVHDYLLAHPELVAEMSDRYQSQQVAAQSKAQQDALKSVGAQALTDPKVAFVAGPKDAKVTVAEFFDYRCPHCKASMAAVHHLLDKGGNVRVAFIERPILTPDSVTAAIAAVAARRQPDKYVPFHFALMATEGSLPKERILDIAKSVGIDTAKLEKDMADPAVLAEVKASNALADKLHFDGTPTFVINNHIVVGELTDDELQQMTKTAAQGT
jgi:protein-disulfide isomerase